MPGVLPVPLAAACAVLLLAVPVGAPAAAAPPSRDLPGDSYQGLLRSASERTGVPEGLLAALALEVSGFDPHPGVASVDGAWGLMGLRDGDDPRLDDAAAAAGLEPGWVRVSDAANVLAGAALLASWAGDPPDPTDPAAWLDPLERWFGPGLDATRLAFAAAVLRAWNEGVATDTDAGGVVMTPPLGADLSGLVPPEAAGDRSDDYGPAAWEPACSTNYTNSSRSGSAVDYVVIHTMEGSYWGSISWAQNCSSEVSFHYAVSFGGDVAQLVDEADIAWHAGNWDYNEASIGIEHEGWIADPDNYTEAMVQASAALTCDIVTDWGIPIDRGHIIGHNEVPDPDGSGWGGSGHHTDPGSFWDWDTFISLVEDHCGGGGGSSTGDLTGFVRDSDIYYGANLVGATVQLHTGASTTTDGDGRYYFYDLPFGTYTVTASYPGYVTASDSKTIESDTLYWKSLALFPDGGGGDDDTPPPDDDTTAPPADDDTTAPPADDDTTGVPGDDDTLAGDDDTVPQDEYPVPPGLERREKVGAGCGCAAATGAADQAWGAGAFGAAALGAIRRRRRR